MRKNVLATLKVGLLVLLTSSGNAQIEFTEHTLDSNFDGASSVYAVDIDSDGDMDVLGTATSGGDIAWWENSGNQELTRHTIAGNYAQVVSVSAADLDGDNDIDLLGAASRVDCITWWENDGEQDFTRHTIAGDFGYANSVHAADVDGDEDMDVLGVSADEDDVAWWENDGEQEFTEHTIAGEFDGATSVCPVDIDGDGDMDICGSAYRANEIAWWENDGRQGFTEHTISNNYLGVLAIHAVDLDGDGDMDVTGAAFEDGSSISWWENDGEQEFTEHSISDDFEGASSVYAADMDSDDDLDILGSSAVADDIAWWENDGEQDFTQHMLSGNFNGASCVYSADIDGDGDMDVLGTAHDASDITWWENMGSPPADFELIFPENHGIVYNDAVTSMWSSSVDHDGLEYFVEWSLFERFPLDSSLMESTEDTFLVISDIRDFLMAGYEIDELPDDAIIYWRVKAVDDFGAFTWANDNENGWSFNVYIPDPPSPFHLLTPHDGTSPSTPDVMLEWETAADPDIGDVITYTVYLSEDEDFTMPDFIDTGEENSLLLDDLTENQAYWWKVLAEDTDAYRSWSIETWSFTYDRYREPTDIRADLNEDNGEVSLTWKHDPGLERFLFFNLYRDDRLINTYVDTFCTDNLPSHGTYRYWLTANYLSAETGSVDTSTVYWGVESANPRQNTNIPLEYSIAGIFPNPFNPATSIVIGLPEPSILNARIYNIFGQQVADLGKGSYTLGYHKFTFNGSNLSSGIYLVRAKVPGKMDEVSKVVLVR
ncbi:FG-GAP-like repeat-containing protein [Calditrichota bacterium]